MYWFGCVVLQCNVSLLNNNSLYEYYLSIFANCVSLHRYNSCLMYSASVYYGVVVFFSVLLYYMVFNTMFNVVCYKLCTTYPHIYPQGVYEVFNT